MSLQLFEVVSSNATREGAQSVIEAIASAAEQNGAQVLESQVTEGQGRVFTVVELDGDDTTALDQAIRSGVADQSTEVTGPDQVRLVGADIEDIRKAKPSAEYLVEWDAPTRRT